MTFKNIKLNILHYITSVKIAVYDI